MKPTNAFLALAPVTALTLSLASFGAAGMAHAESHPDMAGHGSMHVTKSPTCGCCGAWVALAREAGYEVEVTDTRDVTSVKLENDVPGALWSCHTAEIEGYTIEGHVPFAALNRLLNERPDIAGIYVPGMPVGSPGMGTDPSARYDVIAFGGDAASGEIFHRAGQ